MIAGIDLAAKPKNATGICFLDEPTNYELITAYGDDEIISLINERDVEIIGIDAPLMEEIRVREADKILKKYGAMPPTLPSMRILTARAMKIVGKLRGEIIEVFPTATAKILGVYNKDYKKMAEKLKIKARNKHELDAYLAAYTAYLYREGKGIAIGNKEKVIIPKID